MADAIEIPAFLRRTNPSTGEETMRPQDTQAAKSAPEPEKKKRKQVELLGSIHLNGEHVFLQNLTLAELAEAQAEWKQKLANIPQIELELRSINAAIRTKAR